jgi:hypothetical protein
MKTTEFAHVKKVFYSCKTKEQLELTFQWAMNVYKRHFEYQMAIFLLESEMKEYLKERR